MGHLVDYIEVKMPAKSEYIGVIRLTLSGIASRMGYAYEEIEDLKIAVSEACTNVVQHAYKDNAEGETIIGFGVYEYKLEIMIADNGDSFKFEQIRNKLGPYSATSSTDQLVEGGLGLYLMETLMDEVHVFDNSGVTVFMVKYLSGESINHDTTISNYEEN